MASLMSVFKPDKRGAIDQVLSGTVGDFPKECCYDLFRFISFTYYDSVSQVEKCACKVPGPPGVLYEGDFDFRLAQSLEVLFGYSPVGNRLMHGGNIHDQRQAPLSNS